MQRVGLEIGEERIRAVSVNRWTGAPRETFQIRWDPRAPRDAVHLLQSHLGEASSICISVGLEFLHVKKVALPPVSASAKRGILTLEPDRYFALSSTEIVVALEDHSDLIFAADAGVVGQLIDAVDEWAPVEIVEPAPISARRAVSLAGIRSGRFAIPAGADESGIIEISNRKLVSVQRGDGSAHAAPLTLPATQNLSSEFAIAYAVSRSDGASLDETLLPPLYLARERKRRLMSVVRAAVNCALALAFVVGALDRSRERVLEGLGQEIQTVAPTAAGPLAIQSRIAQLDVQSSAVRISTSGHVDPVAVLGALSRRLPHDAVVMSVRADGDEWQIDGTAKDAASIIPALDADPSIANVRSLSGSARINEGTRTYETFSVAFHAGR